MNCVLRNQLVGDALRLVAYCLRCKHYVCHVTRIVHNRAAACFAAGGGIFENQLSTDQFKLKVISRSQLYIYTLNVSCIMVVYYFVPFIVNNRYLLF